MATAAVGLQHVVAVVEMATNDFVIIYTLKGAEYALLLLDLSLFMGFLKNSFKTSIKELWKN